MFQVNPSTIMTTLSSRAVDVQCYRMYRAYLSSCIFWSLAVPVASMVMLNGMCERAVTTYVLGSVWWSSKHVKSYSYPRTRVHTDQGDLSRVKPIGSSSV